MHNNIFQCGEIRNSSYEAFFFWEIISQIDNTKYEKKKNLMLCAMSLQICVAPQRIWCNCAPAVFS